MLVELIRITTRDGVQLDGLLRRPSGHERHAAIDVACLVHGTGGNFYSSSLFDHVTEALLGCGVAVARINTRGHDGISTAVSSKGGLRLGAAYETVDDCRHDLLAWTDWLRANVGQRVALLGHSLGAVKCLYAAAQEPALAPARLIAVSPPRLSYSWFCQGPRAAEFLGVFLKAEALVQAGQPHALMEVTIPLPFAIAAAGYVEKCGPDERYNYLPLLRRSPCPTLVLFGSVEAEKNVAFQQGPEEVAKCAAKNKLLEVKTVAGADHFYSGVRDEAWRVIEGWLNSGASEVNS